MLSEKAQEIIMNLDALNDPETNAALYEEIRLDEELRGDKEFVMEAVKKDPAVLDYVDESFRNDAEVMDIIGEPVQETAETEIEEEMFNTAFGAEENEISNVTQDIDHMRDYLEARGIPYTIEVRTDMKEREDGSFLAIPAMEIKVPAFDDFNLKGIEPFEVSFRDGEFIGEFSEFEQLQQDIRELWDENCKTGFGEVNIDDLTSNDKEKEEFQRYVDNNYYKYSIPAYDKDDDERATRVWDYRKSFKSEDERKEFDKRLNDLLKNNGYKSTDVSFDVKDNVMVCELRGLDDGEYEFSEDFFKGLERDETITEKLAHDRKYGRLEALESEIEKIKKEVNNLQRQEKVIEADITDLLRKSRENDCPEDVSQNIEKNIERIKELNKGIVEKEREIKSLERERNKEKFKIFKMDAREKREELVDKVDKAQGKVKNQALNKYDKLRTKAMIRSFYIIEKLKLNNAVKGLGKVKDVLKDANETHKTRKAERNFDNRRFWVERSAEISDVSRDTITRDFIINKKAMEYYQNLEEKRVAKEAKFSGIKEAVSNLKDAISDYAKGTSIEDIEKRKEQRAEAKVEKSKEPSEYVKMAEFFKGEMDKCREMFEQSKERAVVELKEEKENISADFGHLVDNKKSDVTRADIDKSFDEIINEVKNRDIEKSSKFGSGVKVSEKEARRYAKSEAKEQKKAEKHSEEKER